MVGSCASTSTATRPRSTVALNRKAFDIARRNISNGFGLAESLAGAKNLAEAMELQTSYWRKQVGELASSRRNAHAIHSGDRGCHSA